MHTLLLWRRFAKAHDSHGAQSTYATAARGALIEQYRHLVAISASLMARRLRPGQTREELVSAGNAALVRAVDGFEPARGVKFETYAVMLITYAMYDVLREDPGQVALSLEDWATCENEDPPRRLWELLAAPEEEVYRLAYASLLRRSLSVGIAGLSARERYVIENHYGLGGRRAQTFREIGARLGVSQVRAYEIHIAALLHLRQGLEPQGE
jgi:RNA polymerase sporulation-specific sigma factor